MHTMCYMQKVSVAAHPNFPLGVHPRVISRRGQDSQKLCRKAEELSIREMYIQALKCRVHVRCSAIAASCMVYLSPRDVCMG